MIYDLIVSTLARNGKEELDKELKKHGMTSASAQHSLLFL